MTPGTIKKPEIRRSGTGKLEKKEPARFRFRQHDCLVGLVASRAIDPGFDSRLRRGGGGGGGGFRVVLYQ